MLFCRTSVLNDSTMNFIDFQVLGLRRTTTNPSKPSPGIVMEMCIEMTPSKIQLLLEKDVSGPPKSPQIIEKLTLDRQGTPLETQRSPKTQQSISMVSKMIPKALPSIPNTVKTATKHQSPAPVTGHESPLRGRRQGAKPLRFAAPL